MLTGRRSKGLSSRRPGIGFHQPTSTKATSPRAIQPWGLETAEAALRSIETGSKSGDRDRIRDTTSFPDRSFDVSFDRTPEILVRHGALDQAVELTTRERKLLRGLHPGIRRGRKRSEELRQPLFVECRHVCHRSPDGSEGSDLPSSWARSFLRQREMRLAIVPGAMARASPIV